jgi:hypothetical protein
MVTESPQVTCFSQMAPRLGVYSSSYATSAPDARGDRMLEFKQEIALWRAECRAGWWR